MVIKVILLRNILLIILYILQILAVDVRSNKIEVHKKTTEPWKITLIDTGQDSLTGDIE